MKPNYIVYMHTFKTSGKSYIGVTCSGLSYRLKKHFNNAVNGSSTLFSRAIRKYGLGDLVSLVIESGLTEQEAFAKEKQYILEYNTKLPSGYNMTNGGDGGDICNNLPENKKRKYREKLKARTSGLGNPNSCKVTDREIVDLAVRFFIENKRSFIRSRWWDYCRLNGLPVHYYSYRFDGGGMKKFISLVKEELANQKIVFLEDDFATKKSSIFREKCRLTSLGKKHYNDGINGFHLLPSDPKIKLLNLKLGKNVKNRKN